MLHPHLVKHHSLKYLLRKRKFVEIYVVLSLLVLFATTILWSTLSAHVHLSNADQLVNPYLFESADTFQNAVFPGQHSFLIKWPLFILMKQYGFSAATFTVFTIAVSLLTVFALVYVLYRIDKRPLYFGTVCLAIASTLLMIPAQPYPGGLLPVGMGMITTRNIEYIVFIVALILVARSANLRAKKFWAGVAVLAVLIASDKLFMSLSIASALGGFVVYVIRRKWHIAGIYAQYLLAGICATVIAFGVLYIIPASGLTHIDKQSGLSPYNLTSSASDVAHGVGFAGLGLLSNFGANPTYGAVKVSGIAQSSLRHYGSLAGLPLFINLCILIFGIVAVTSTLRITLRRAHLHADTAILLTTFLTFTSLLSVVIFIATKHYYVVDARYIAVTYFTVFVGITTYLRKKTYTPRQIVVVGFAIFISIICGVFVARNTSILEKFAMQEIDQRNSAVANIIRQRQTGILVGDYWRVMPIKQISSSAVDVYPLDACIRGREVLASSSWRKDIRKQSFTYLLSFDKSLTDFPQCTLSEVTSYYGKPSATMLVAGTLDNPTELLLFYNGGIQGALASRNLPETTVAPISLERLLYTKCSGSTTIINVVAHEDDDLLFMNPDVSRDLKSGHCVRTIYVTTGDGGNGQSYWIGRRQGAQNAYSQMLGRNNQWTERTVKLNDHQFVTVANPKGFRSVSLVFMNLPDGGLLGKGFQITQRESLESLEAGKIAKLHSVDGQSTYTSAELTTALALLINTFEPTEVNTLSNSTSKGIADHSDHKAVSRYVSRVLATMPVQPPLIHYMGYPARQLPENIAGDELHQKMDYFFEYAKFDGAVCQTVEQCNRTVTYNNYLKRQYTNPQ